MVKEEVNIILGPQQLPTGVEAATSMAVEQAWV